MRFSMLCLNRFLAWAGCWLLLSGALAFSQPAAAQTQEPPSQKPPSQDQSALVDGLLDLLSEPPPVRTLESQGQPMRSPVPGADNAGTTEADPLGPALDPSLAEHPLTLVRKNMRAAATQLGKGVVGAETRQLQADILQRLDSLIQELQQADPSQSAQSQSQQQQSSASQTQSASGAESSQTQSDESGALADSGPNAEPQSSGEQAAQDGTSQAGSAAATHVDLADPERLQQDVWGQLPEQVRKQMQSRMVERFLPSYRPQIEAYFRALLQSKQR